MSPFIKKYRYFLIGICVGAVLVYSSISLNNNRKTSELRLEVETSIEQSLTSLKTSATLVSNGGVSTAAERVMSDCTATERASFEGGLIKLDSGLSASELDKIDALFSRCAPVQAVRRSVMVAELEANINDLGRLIEQRKILGSFTSLDTNYQEWRAYLASEKLVSKLSYDLVELQREIIQSLRNGTPINSTEADTLRARGQSIRSEINESSTQAQEILRRLMAE